jgi:hypothetical protein
VSGGGPGSGEGFGGFIFASKGKREAKQQKIRQKKIGEDVFGGDGSDYVHRMGQFMSFQEGVDKVGEWKVTLV